MSVTPLSPPQHWALQIPGEGLRPTGPEPPPALLHAAAPGGPPGRAGGRPVGLGGAGWERPSAVQTHGGPDVLTAGETAGQTDRART